MLIGIGLNKAHTQNYHLNYEYITTKQGLSNNFVNHIIQDKEGFIWIATQDGLNKYDGYNFEVFKVKHHHHNSLPSNTINVLAEDKEGNIWIGTEKGLAKWHKLSQKIETFAAFKNQKITSIYQDSYNTIWVSTYHKILFLEKGSQKWVQSMKVSANVGTPLFGYIGEHLIGNHKELFMLRFASVGNNVFYQYLYGLDRKTKRWDKILQAPFRTLYISPKKQVLFINKPKQVKEQYKKKHIRLYDSSFAIQHIVVPQNEIIHQKVFDGVIQKNGRMFVTDVRGLLEIDTKNQKVMRFWSAKLFANDIEKYGINSMLIDKGGNLWIYGMGITLIPKDALDNPKTYCFEKGKPSPLGGSSVRSIYQDDLGYIWAGTYHETGNPLDVFLGNHKYPINLNNPTVISKIMPDPINTTIVWAVSNGLHKIDKQTKKYLKTYRENSYLYYSLYPVSDSEIWLASVDSLHQFNPKTNKTTNSYRVDGINHIWIDDENNVWLATRSKGLALLDQETGKIKYFSYQENNPKSITSNNVKSVYEDTKGRFWVATALGLNLFDRQSKTFTYFTEEDGLPNNMVYATLEDRQGNLWLSTNKGISKFNPESSKFTNFDDRDGLQDNEFNTNAFFKNEITGEMFFGGIKGITSFFPEQMQKNSFVPPIVLTSFKRKGQVVSLDKPIAELREIRMNYDEAQSLTFEFVALSFFQSKRNQYAYKIEELHEDWIDLGTTHELTLTNLNASTYTLHIKGSNNHGLWNEKGLEIMLIIKPPFWQTWWFRGVLGVLFMALVYGVYRMRVYQIKQRALFLEQQVKIRTEEVQVQAETLEQQAKELSYQKQELDELNKAKDRFFSIIAHDLRSPITSFESIAKQLDFFLEHQEPERIRKLGKNIQNSAQNLNNLLDNLLNWALLQRNFVSNQPELLDLQNVITEVASYYQNALRLHQITLVKDIPEGITIYIDQNALMTILRNLLNNAIKFTPKQGKIIIRSYKKDAKIFIELQDNGLGIEADKIPDLFKINKISKSKDAHGQKGTGLGLLLVWEFVQASQGQINVFSEINRGTTMQIVLPDSHSKI